MRIVTRSFVPCAGAKGENDPKRLGELTDFNPKYIGEVERMEKTILVDALACIAAALKVRLRDLVRDS
ncbi:MAG: hypothetical protein P4L87_13540 [Formivibrio sp.]|nr:hypothetical protein [Formivibrio sp.]